MESSDHSAGPEGDRLEVIEVDLDRPAHQEAVLALTTAYALDPMGNSGPLTPDVLARLISGLKSHLTTLVLLGYKGGQAVGLATCFRGFSTFAAQPLINIHDLIVLSEHRNLGIGRFLLAAIEQKARDLDCCKVTLEVQENNTRSRHTYAQAGFNQGLYNATTGGSLFYWKTL